MTNAELVHLQHILENLKKYNRTLWYLKDLTLGAKTEPIKVLSIIIQEEGIALLSNDKYVNLKDISSYNFVVSVLDLAFAVDEEKD